MYSNHHIKTGLHSPLLITMTCAFIKDSIFFLSVWASRLSSGNSSDFCAADSKFPYRCLTGTSQNIPCTTLAVTCPTSVLLQVPTPVNGPTQEVMQGACKAWWASWPPPSSLAPLLAHGPQSSCQNCSGTYLQAVSSYSTIYPDKDVILMISLMLIWFLCWRLSLFKSYPDQESIISEIFLISWERNLCNFNLIFPFLKGISPFLFAS